MVYTPNPGAGFEFENTVVGGSVPKEYVPAVVKGTEGHLPSLKSKKVGVQLCLLSGVCLRHTHTHTHTHTRNSLTFQFGR